MNLLKKLFGTRQPETVLMCNEAQELPPFEHVVNKIVPALKNKPSNVPAFASFVVFSEAGYWPGFDDNKIGREQFTANEARIHTLTLERAEQLAQEFNALPEPSAEA